MTVLSLITHDEIRVLTINLHYFYGYSFQLIESPSIFVFIAFTNDDATAGNSEDKSLFCFGKAAFEGRDGLEVSGV